MHPDRQMERLGRVKELAKLKRFAELQLARLGAPLQPPSAEPGLGIRIRRMAGAGCLVLALAFFLLHNFVIWANQTTHQRHDWLGLHIPTPPDHWVFMLPWLGSALGFLFESLSWHGLVGIAVLSMLVGAGGALLGWSKK